MQPALKNVPQSHSAAFVSQIPGKEDPHDQKPIQPAFNGSPQDEHPRSEPADKTDAAQKDSGGFVIFYNSLAGEHARMVISIDLLLLVLCCLCVFCLCCRHRASAFFLSEREPVAGNS